MNIDIITLQDEKVLATEYLRNAIRSYHGWYQEHGFLVMPRLVPKLTSSVYLPFSDLLLTEEFRKWAENLPEYIDYPTLEGMDNKRWFNKLQSIIEVDNASFYVREENHIKELVEKVMKWWDQNFGLKKNRIKVQVIPKNFGTVTSFWSRLDDPLYTLSVAVRTDVPEAFLVEGIISALLVDKLSLGDSVQTQTWQQREFLTDFLLHQSSLNKLFDIHTHTETLDALTNDQYQRLEYKLESNNYLKQLAFPFKENYKLDWQQIEFLLSPHEFLILKELWNVRQTVVLYDRLAEVLYTEDSFENFSLQYLAKVVEQIRKKLKKIGIDNVIFTKRGEGYVWME